MIMRRRRRKLSLVTVRMSYAPEPHVTVECQGTALVIRMLDGILGKRSEEEEA